MAPELGGMVPPGHAERVATLASAMGEQLGLARRTTSTTSRWRRSCTTSGRSRSTIPGRRPARAASRHRGDGRMLREIRPLAGAGEIVAGDVDDRSPQARRAGAAARERVRRPDGRRRHAAPTSRSSRCGPRRVRLRRARRSSALERAVRRRAPASASARRLAFARPASHAVAVAARLGRTFARSIVAGLGRRCRSVLRATVRRLALAARVVGDVAEADREDEVAEAE